jgi:hypothetical protein
VRKRPNRNRRKLTSGHSETVDFGSGQGRSEFETAGVAELRRGFQIRENAGLGQKMMFMDGHYWSYKSSYAESEFSTAQKRNSS